MRGSVVLVHGAWSWPEDWRWVVEELDAKGVEVRAVDLPSHRSSSAVRADDVALVENTIAELPEPVVAVGWSYGGAVITDINADNVNIARLVYVASMPVWRLRTTGPVVANSTSHCSCFLMTTALFSTMKPGSVSGA